MMRVAACPLCGQVRLTSWLYCADCKRELKAQGKRKEAQRKQPEGEYQIKTEDEKRTDMVARIARFYR